MKIPQGGLALLLSPIFLVTLLRCGPAESPRGAVTDRATTPSAEELRLGQSSDSIFYTLNPKLPTEGPVLTSSNQDEYVTEIFRLIVKHADQQARPYLNRPEDHEAYWAFLLGSMIVPFHESSLQHFRELSPLGRRCIPDMNTGARLKRLRRRDGTIEPRYYAVFEHSMLNGNPPAVLPCESLDPNTSATQLVGSYDSVSNGIMQFNIGAHLEDYYRPQKFASVPETIALGLQYYMRFFSALYRSAEQYACLRPGPDRGDPIDYKNLIHSAWACYNGGNLGQACRYARPTSGLSEAEARVRDNDEKFDRELRAMTLSGGANPFADHLKGLDGAAFQEIVDNFNDRRDSRDAVDQILIPPAQAIGADSVRIHDQPSASDSSACGTARKGDAVEILGRTDVWLRVRFPPEIEKNLGASCGEDKYVIADAVSDRDIATVTRGKVTHVTYLNLRADPPRGAVIGALRDGDSVEIVDQKELSDGSGYPWYRIKWSDGAKTRYGWVYGGYIQIAKGHPR